jgi:hypothetical protein
MRSDRPRFTPDLRPIAPPPGTPALAPQPPVGAGRLEELARAVDEALATPDDAPKTAKAYAGDWFDFEGFCRLHGLEPLPGSPADGRPVAEIA